VVFNSTATNLVPYDNNAYEDTFVRGPDESDLSADFSGDGDLKDTMLGAFDVDFQHAGGDNEVVKPKPGNFLKGNKVGVSCPVLRPVDGHVPGPVLGRLDQGPSPIVEGINVNPH